MSKLSLKSAIDEAIWVIGKNTTATEIDFDFGIVSESGVLCVDSSSLSRIKFSVTIEKED